MASRSETEALYRLVESEEVTFEALSKPHQRETVARCREQGVVLVAHDSTDFRYKGVVRSGLGRVSTSTDKCQGFYGHFSLAVSADGRRELLGVLAVQRWARAERGVTTRVRAGELSGTEARQLPRESARWGEGVRQVQSALTESGVSPIHIMDSEADDFALFCQLISSSARFVVRGFHKRKLAGPAKHMRTLQEFVAQLPVSFEVYTDISKRKVRTFDDRKRQQKRETRTAQLAFSAAVVGLKRPDTVEKELPRELELNVVYVRELAPPEGQEPVDWTLFTTEPIDSDEQVSRIVNFYRARWVIEEFFKRSKRVAPSKSASSNPCTPSKMLWRSSFPSPGVYSDYALWPAIIPTSPRTPPFSPSRSPSCSG